MNDMNNVSRFSIVHDNVKIHFNTEREIKDYIERIGRKKITVYEHKIVFDRTATHIKIDRL